MVPRHLPHRQMEKTGLHNLILLVEPAYRARYPPLGLMKIAQFHKERGDHVEFVHGLSEEMRDRWRWDRIYVSSLFTYDWAQTTKALRDDAASVRPPSSQNLVVGGVMATLMAEDIRQALPCRVVTGLIDSARKLGYAEDDAVDCLLPDYSILNETSYKYPASNAYLAYATRGCVRKCAFCAVPIIEPGFNHYVPLAQQIEQVAERYGPRKDLLLLDNNVLASHRFVDIIAEIKRLGFQRDALFHYESKAGRKISAHRHVDFNQGVDVRLLDDAKMGLLSEIAIKPLRLAFDKIEYRAMYEQKVRLAERHEIRDLSNYILFNHDDRPQDLYERLRLNVELNQELGLQIFSFPMRYINLASKSRLASAPGNVGANWCRKYLRAIQCILVRTRGVVGTHLDYFEEAFGHDLSEFQKILVMPEDYIIHRHDRAVDGSTELWWSQYSDLSLNERRQLLAIVEGNAFERVQPSVTSARVLQVLEHYLTPRQKVGLFQRSLPLVG